MKRIFLCACFLSIFSCVKGQSLRQDSSLVKKQLPNGLTYYIYHTDDTEGQAYFRLFVKAGSLQEKPDQRGLAHFLEHMAFNGTAHFQKNELVDFLESKGARFGTDLNAHTSYNETIYKLKVPTSDSLVVDSTLTILRDWTDGISLDSTEVKKERGVILSEWLSKQSPGHNLQKAFLSELIDGSRYAKREVIGDTLVIKHASAEDLGRFYHRWYDPSLMAVAISGDVDTKRIEKMIRDQFSSIKSNGQHQKIYNIPSFKKIEAKIYTDQSTNKIELNAINLVPPLKKIDDEKTYRAYLKRKLINDLFGERFEGLSHQNPAYKNGSASTGNFFPVKAARLASVTLKPDSINTGIKQYFSQLGSIYHYGFTNLEIKKVKKEYISALQTKAEDKSGPSAKRMIAEMNKNFFYQNDIISKKEELKLARKYISEIDSSVIAHSLNQAMLRSKPHYLLTANKKYQKDLPSVHELKSMIAKAREDDITRYENDLSVPNELLQEQPTRGRILSESKITEINARKIELSNGIKVIYKQTDLDNNTVIVSGFRKGGFYALDSLNYVNGLFSDPVISASGYGRFSRQALSYYLAGNSAKVLMLPDHKRTGFYGSAKADDRQTLFELLYLKWMAPRVSSKKFNQIKRQAKKSIENRTLTPLKSFNQDLKQIIKGKDYVTRQMSLDDIERSLNQDSISVMYHRFFGSAHGYTVSVVSDQPYDSLRTQIATYLGGLPNGPVDTAYRYNYDYTLDENIDFIRHNADSPKARVSLIFQQKKPIRNVGSVELKNNLLEEVLKNKLLNRLREELGGVYSVGVSIHSTNHPTSLSRQIISFVTEPGKVDNLVDETKSILNQMTLLDADDTQQVKNVKTNLLENHKEKVQGNTFWTSAIRDHYFEAHRSWRLTTNYESELKNISRHELAALAALYFKNQPMIKAVLYPKQAAPSKP